MWIKGFPKKEGTYWLHGYRYGKISCGLEAELVMILLKVRPCANGMLNVSDGQFVHESEVEEVYFMEAILPEPPERGEEYDPTV